MSSDNITLTGTLSDIKPDDARRIAIYIVRGSEVLAWANVRSDGSIRISLAKQAIMARSAYGLEAVVGPSGLGHELGRIPQLQRIPLQREQLEHAETEVHIPLEDVRLSEDVLKAWWLWCRLYCVGGVVVGPDGCPVPGAEVTAYNVTYTFGGGFTKTLRATATTDANGRFTVCFNWCTTFFCWCCWPFWWLCWPWWWERDILHVIENIESMAMQMGAVRRSTPLGGQGPLALSRPPARDLMRGQGFVSSAQRTEPLTLDPTRTALIQRKFADARIRAIFPWWWWCCDDPNIVFGVTEGPNTIVDEDPAMDTRWCLEDGSSVTLVGNEQTISACPDGIKPTQGFVWTRVGNIPIDAIHGGYADGAPGTDTSDLAFAGTLDIFGEFAVVSNVAYYQVNAGQWSGDPSRGGMAPISSTPISVELYNHVIILHADLTVTHADVKMGPFNTAGLTNLYAVQEQRPNMPAGLLPPFPIVNPGDTVFWAYNGRKAYANASDLIGGRSLGGVDLTVTGYDATFAPVALPGNPDDTLTLEIDNAGLTATHINGLQAFRADNTPVTSTGTAGACPAYDIGPGGYVRLNVTVTDANGHLFEYEIAPDFGSGSTGTTTPGLRGYQQPGPFPGAPYQGPNTAQKSFVGGTEDITFYPAVDCCYDFRLNVGKRVTNGQFFPTLYTADFQTATLKVT